MTQTVLITGNQGYIGPVLTRYLRERHPQLKVIGLDTGFFAELSQFPNELDFPHQQIKKDVRDVTVDDLKGVDSIIHLAAISNDPMGKTYAEATDEINHRASVEIAKTAKKAGVKQFIFASSCSVYGDAMGRVCDEGAPLNPLSEYAKSKAHAEKGLEPLADPSFKIVAFRFATACGASSRIRLDLVLNDFVATAITQKKIEILSDGTPWRPLIDVKDMSRSIEWALFESTQETPYLVLNAGRSQWNFQVLDLAKVVAKICGDIPYTVNPKAAPDGRSYAVNFGEFEKRKILAAPRTLDQTVQEVLSLLRETQNLSAEFRTSRFMRLKVLSDLKIAGKINESLRWNS